jgi:hypothetical protein
MTEYKYNWKRFFCPREGYLDLSDGGYLFDPDTDSTWAKFHNHDLKTFNYIVDTPCLVILGERGMGKSRLLEAQKDNIEAQVKARGGQLLWLDLRSLGDENRLDRKLFNSEKFSNWTTGAHELHIWLDSFDECQLQIRNLVKFLIDELKPHTDKIKRLFLRIACRTAEWPNSLEQQLHQLWKGEGQSVGIYELAPLRRKDVIEAATVNNLNLEKFLTEIGRTQTVPFAIKPVTLKFLIDIYKNNGELPQTQAELYLKGCQLLCEETNPDRRDSGLIGKLTAQQRMVVASRIAAITLFSNHPVIWKELDQGTMPNGDLAIEQLYGGKETAQINEFPMEFEVGQDEIREVLGTALFSGRGTSGMGWAHQSYADFLAARYLKDRKLELTQMLALITHPDDAEKHLVPQLYETAAWLGTMDREVFQAIMRTDPDVLLLSDVASADETDRAALVEGLLKLLDEGKLRHQYDRQYSKLKHSNIDQQLRPYLQDKSKGLEVRNVVIDIAEGCEVHSLQQDLADITLDSTENIEIRVNAAQTVNRIGNESTKIRLKPLTTVNASEDPDDRLKLCGLRATWPNFIGLQELLTLLNTPSRTERAAQIYFLFFLEIKIIKNIQPTDLPIALNWIVNQPRHSARDYFENFTNEIVTFAWKHRDIPDVFIAFAEVAVKRLKDSGKIVSGDMHTQESFIAELYADNVKRLALVEEMILSGLGIGYLLSRSPSPLVCSEDIPWIIERLHQSQSEESRQLWAQIIWSFQGELTYYDAIIIAATTNPILKEMLPLKMDLDSPQARRQAEEYQERTRYLQEPPLLNPTPEKRIENCLIAFESGNSYTWLQLVKEMSLKPDSTHYLDTLEPNLTILPGWTASNLKTQGRIIRAAKTYVLNGDPQTDKWLGTNSIYVSATEGYRAIQLLLREEPIFIPTIPPGVWQKWAPVILDYHIQGDPETEALQKELLRLTYQHASNEILSTLEFLIDKEIYGENVHSSVIDRVRFCWDERIAQMLLNKAQTENLGLSHLERLLNVLLEQNDKKAVAYAESLIQLRIQQRKDGKRNRISFQRATVAARVLMTHSSEINWKIIWSAIEQDTHLGRKIAESVSTFYDLNYDRDKDGLILEEEQIRKLYIWLTYQYPFVQKLDQDRVFVPTIRYSIARWRNLLLYKLRNSGTVRACEQMQRIVNEFPDLKFLKEILTEAQHKTRQNTWRAPEPQDVLKLTQGQNNHLVQNGEQLLEVLIESLKRLQQKLQGETPQAFTLWDRQASSSTWQPKDENHFSDYVKNFLNDDLKLHKIMVNREVEFRRGTGGRPGERLDIQVEVFSPGHDRELNKITAIIEVKGCWNEGLNSAMQDQLLNRYLEESQCRHGLYLIGWYFCSQWDEEHTPKKNARRFTRNFSDLSSAQIHFDEQASALSQDGKYVRAFVMNTALR